MRSQPANLRTALVSVDPRTGAVLAYYGGDNGVGLDYAQVLKQPGSSFKPFVMAAALQHNPPIGLGERYDGSSPQTIAGQTVANSDGDSCDNCDLKTAMTKSINTVYYQLAVQVGPAAVAQAAHQAGIPANLLPNPTAGIALGDKEVHPEDMASAYATFAADGVYHAPHLVTRVETADGRVLYDGGPDPGEKRMDAQVARNVTESMVDVASSSLIPLAGGRPVAAKTGTTQSRIAGQNNDAWTVGYTPSISTAVWVGTDDNSPIKTSGGSPIYGRMVPGSIWQQFMNTALRAKPVEQFSKFVPLGTPPSDSWGDDNSDDEDSDQHRHDDSDSSHSDNCGLFSCDGDGGLLGGHHRHDSDSDSNDDDN
jgi:membrane peptidoglycan carboxypeptidase